MASEKRLIDAIACDEAIVEAMRKYNEYDNCDLMVIGGLVEAQDLLAEAPTVDAIIPVRCKDCKYAHLTHDNYVKYCDMWEDGALIYLSPDFYCGFAVRRCNK